jgi:hypothetical protein
MPHTVASVVITATPSNLTLGQSGTYAVVADTLGDPGLNWRYGYATSPWVDSQLLTSAVKDKATLNFEVDVTGTTIANLVANITALRTALSQFTYTTTVTVGGQSVAYTCDPGRLSKKGGTWQDERLAHITQRLAVSIPVNPE